MVLNNTKMLALYNIFKKTIIMYTPYSIQNFINNHHNYIAIKVVIPIYSYFYIQGITTTQ